MAERINRFKRLMKSGKGRKMPKPGTVICPVAEARLIK